MNDGSAFPAPTAPERAPLIAAEWKFALEIAPDRWRCPATPFWIAGWIMSSAGEGAADVRAWVGSRLYLGLCGLPRADAELATLGRVGPPHAGFSFLLTADADAQKLRLEVCDEAGQWQEFLRQKIGSDVAAKSDEHDEPCEIGDPAAISRAVLAMLVARRASPTAAWRALADEALLSAIARPLDALPNPPLFGRLELPAPIATIRYGLLEIGGWIAHREQRIKRLQAFVGATKPVTLLHGRKRRDVTDVFGELRDGDHSQFIGYIQIPPGTCYPASLRIIAELENGERHLAFNQRFRPSAPVQSFASLPDFSPLTFGRAVVAFRQAAKRHDRSLGTNAEFREGLGAAWEYYRASAPVEPRVRPELERRSAFSAAPGGRRREVVVVTHNLNREGAPLIAFEYASYLKSQTNWSVRVVSPEEGPLHADYSAAGIAVTHVKLDPVWSSPSAEALEASLDQLAAADHWEGADLIVANTMVASWAIHVAKRLGKPAILYVHESAAIRIFFAPFASPAAISSVERAFGAASAVVFAAAASANAHAPHQGNGNFRLLRSWIDARAITSYAAVNSPLTLRRAKKVPEDAVVFVNIGSVSERKGQHVFLEAIDLMQRKTRRLEGTNQAQLVFLIVGASPGPLVDFLRHEIARRELAGVELVEKVSDPYAYFRLADVFVCSSFEESLPRVVLEAAAFGLPIVSTNVDGIPEILDESDAWLVPAGDAGQLATAMEAALASYLADDSTRAKRAQRKVCAEFDSSVLLPQHAAFAEAVAAASVR